MCFSSQAHRASLFSSRRPGGGSWGPHVCSGTCTGRGAPRSLDAPWPPLHAPTNVQRKYKTDVEEGVRVVGSGSPMPDEEAGSARWRSPSDGPPGPVWRQRERKPERPREEQTVPGRTVSGEAAAVEGSREAGPSAGWVGRGRETAKGTQWSEDPAATVSSFTCCPAEQTPAGPRCRGDETRQVVWGSGRGRRLVLRAGSSPPPCRLAETGRSGLCPLHPCLSGPGAQAHVTPALL